MPLIRPAQLSDSSIIAAIHQQGWQAAYGGLVDQAYLDSLSLEARTQDWQGWLAAGETTTFIAELEGKPAGFITWGRTRTAPPGDSKIRPQYPAEIYALYLAPDYWRKGIGKALLRAVFEDIAQNRLTGACLWVVKGNARATGFYEATGGQRIGKKQIEIGPSPVTELCFGWRSVKTSLAGWQRSPP